MSPDRSVRQRFRPSALLVRALPVLMPLVLLPAHAQSPQRQAPAPAPATSPSPSTRSAATAMTPQQIRASASQFVNGVRTGCLQSKTAKSPPNLEAACTCYANSFATRYSPRDLAILNNAASLSRDAVGLMVLMASPERRACEQSAASAK